MANSRDLKNINTFLVNIDLSIAKLQCNVNSFFHNLQELDKGELEIVTKLGSWSAFMDEMAKYWTKAWREYIGVQFEELS